MQLPSAVAAFSAQRHAPACLDFALSQITAGEQIDLAFGAKLGLSSMAAAGLGNAVADVVGINISHSIEVRRRSRQIRSAQMRSDQIRSAQVRTDQSQPDHSWLSRLQLASLLGLSLQPPDYAFSLPTTFAPAEAHQAQPFPVFGAHGGAGAAAADAA